MVASVSARRSVAAAAGYYSHMAHDDYYTRASELPGEWNGKAADRLALSGPVGRAQFEAALKGLDPLTNEPLVQLGRQHAPGWDVTFSAPKSVSVFWALSDPATRARIETAHQQAVKAAIAELEATSAWTRRGAGGHLREQTAGLLVARFDHQVSRDLDPQLHSHAFVFNLAPRRDGSWGSIVSRDLYRAQKAAGATFRSHLAASLEQARIPVERFGTGFRIPVIPREVERAFSKRRQAIESAADSYGYRTPKGMEMAALRTRKSKRDLGPEVLFETWKTEARALGFNLEHALRQHQIQPNAHTPQGSNRSPGPASIDHAVHVLGQLLRPLHAAGSAQGGGSAAVNLRAAAGDKPVKPKWEQTSTFRSDNEARHEPER